jgi:hypothetical protein
VARPHKTARLLCLLQAFHIAVLELDTCSVLTVLLSLCDVTCLCTCARSCGTKAAAPFSLLRLQFHLPLWVRKWVLGAALASGVLEKLVPRYGLVLQLDKSGKPHCNLANTWFILFSVCRNGSEVLSCNSSCITACKHQQSQ